MRRFLNVLLAGMGSAVIGWSCNTQEIEGAAQTGPSANDCQEHVQNALAAQSVSVDSPRGRVIPLEQAKAELNERLSEEEQKNQLASLSEREAIVVQKEEDLRLAQAQIEAQLVELSTLRDQNRDLLAEMDEDREDRVTRLYKMLENMRPAQAAAVLEGTSQPIALEVLMRMNQAKAGRTLAEMNPDQAGVLADQLGAATVGR